MTHNRKHDDWNPQDAAVLADQTQAYDEMRGKCPVAHSQLMDWSLFQHADITAVLADPETFSNQSEFPAIPNGMNPPLHGPYYKALAAFFEPSQLAGFESRARTLAVELLQPLLASGEGEFITAFSTPFAFKALCQFLGWPESQSDCLAKWTHDTALSTDKQTGKALADSFTAHVKANLNTHRDPAEQAQHDTSHELLQTEIMGQRLSDEEIVSLLRNWVAGHSTVAAGLGLVMLHLAKEPELQQRLRGEPSLIPAAIEEILRVDGPLIANRRTTTREVEIQGRTLPQGAKISLMWMAANRDPQAFADPGTVKLERETEAGLVWGQGIHICLGAPLARLEMRVAVEQLLLHTQHIVLSSVLPQREVYPNNGLASLHLQVS